MCRIVLALLLLPFPLFAVAVVAGEPGALRTPVASGHIAAGAMFILVLYVYLTTIALPALLVCMWRRWLGLFHSLVIGLFCGLLALAAPPVGNLFDNGLHLHFRLEQLQRMVLGAYRVILFGGFGGVLFWFMAFWRNPYVIGRVAGTPPPTGRQQRAT